MRRKDAIRSRWNAQRALEKERRRLAKRVYVEALLRSLTRYAARYSSYSDSYWHVARELRRLLSPQERKRRKFPLEEHKTRGRALSRGRAL